jgi:hypothetical protein
MVEMYINWRSASMVVEKKCYEVYLQTSWKPHGNLIITSYYSWGDPLKVGRVNTYCLLQGRFPKGCMKIYEVSMRFPWGFYEVLHNTSCPLRSITIEAERQLMYISANFAKFGIKQGKINIMVRNFMVQKVCVPVFCCILPPRFLSVNIC